MATITTEFTPPTVYVPAAFTVTISPTEAFLLLTEMAPQFSNPNGLRTACPTTFALIAAMQVAIAQSQQPATEGAQPTPVTVTVTL